MGDCIGCHSNNYLCNRNSLLLIMTCWRHYGLMKELAKKNLSGYLFITAEGPSHILTALGITRSP